MSSETIYALASGKGRAGVAVVRISGARAKDVLEGLGGGRNIEPRHASLRVLIDPANGERIDQGLILWMPGPDSFTGEDTLECHVHGGPATLDRLFLALEQMEDVRLAEPGEFSRRAFENGRMDLTEAEGLNDLVWAETEAQRKQALRQMEGALGQIYGGWSAKLTAALALLEANIDFADEDLPKNLADEAMFHVKQVFDELLGHVDDGQRGQVIRDGYRVVILGKPNSGKSSLLNVLAKEDLAIVSEAAGTTRDVISVRMDLGGYPVTVFDTAGLRESTDEVEREGVRRARLKEQEADLRIYLAEVADGPDFWPDEVIGKTTGAAVLVMNKIDLMEAVGNADELHVSDEQDGSLAHGAVARFENEAEEVRRANAVASGRPVGGDSEEASALFDSEESEMPNTALSGSAEGAESGPAPDFVETKGRVDQNGLAGSRVATQESEVGALEPEQNSGRTEKNADSTAGAEVDASAAAFCSAASVLDRAREKGSPVFGVSALSGQGIEALMTFLEQKVTSALELDEGPGITRARHRYALTSALESLERFLKIEKGDPALAAEDIRLALRSLGRLTGRVDVEDILDVVFREFCIGK
jgi:tRNA modification GTPase